MHLLPFFIIKRKMQKKKKMVKKFIASESA